jgi:hypothetical protein
VSQSDGYRLVEQLGQGLSGGVFLAESAAGRVAIRQFQTQAEPSSAEWLAQREHFLQGARQAAGLMHSRIVSVLEVIDEETDAYVAMEYVCGETLANALGREFYTPEKANYLLRNLAVALDYAHQNGVTHGDLKPSNIFVLPQGGWKIGDFAISPRTWRERPGDFPAAWVHPYLAPEAIAAPQTIGPRTDRYALAAIAYHLYTGEPMFAGSDDAGSAIVRGVIPAPSRIKRQVLSAADAVLLHALSPDPQRRYGSCLEFVDSLEASLAPQEPVAAAALAGFGGNKLFYGLGALGLIAAGVVAAALWPFHTPHTVAKAPPDVKTTDARPADSREADGRRAVEKTATTQIVEAKRSPLPKTNPVLNQEKPTERPAQDAAIVIASVPPRHAAAGNYRGASVEPYRSSGAGLPDSLADGTGKQSDPRGTSLQIFSRNRVVDLSIGISMKDPALGELAEGDLKVAVSVSSPLPKGRLSVEWLLDGHRMNLKAVDPQQLTSRSGAVLEYGNEPTPGTYRVVLRAENNILKELTFRITP